MKLLCVNFSTANEPQKQKAKEGILEFQTTTIYILPCLTPAEVS